MGWLWTGFNNVSEVIRDALRFKREAEARDYLNPPPLPPGTMEKVYRRQSKEEPDLEARAARGLSRRQASAIKGAKAEAL